MKKNKALNIATIIIAILPIISFLFLYNKLPEQVPMHFNFNGEVDDYGSKLEFGFLAILPILIYLMMKFLPNIDPKKENYKKFQGFYDMFIFAITLFLSFLFAAITCTIMGTELFNISFICLFAVGILLIFIGNYMPKVKQNFYMGIKTPWTLSSEKVWIKTQRLGGYLFAGQGLYMVVCSFITNAITIAIMIVGLFVVVIVPFVYSYILFKNEKENNIQN